MGYTEAELRALTVSDISPDFPPTRWPAHWQALRQQQTLSFESTQRRKDGSTVPVEITANYINFKGHEYNCAFVRDISVRKQNEKEYSLMQEAVERSSTSFQRLSSTGKVLYANHHACETLGYTREEMLNMSVWDFDPDFPQEAWAPMWEGLRKDGIVHIETRHQRKDGTIFPVAIVGNHIKNADEEFSLVFCQDITERKQAEQHISTLAYFDGLTGLPNRALLHDRLAMMLASSHRDKKEFAVLFMDLDRFKYINDSLGHAAGDKLLQEIARRLKACIRETDTVSRIGGDEFILLLPDTGADGAVHVAGNILAAVRKEVLVDDKPLHTQASIGISLFPHDAQDAQKLIKYADMAMYEAKDKGRNNYQIFTPEIDQQTNEIFSIESDLRQAIEHDELILHYQPQINLADGALCGVEALLRWNHPTKGLMAPAEFIGIAEDSGQIINIGKWVLQTACRQLVLWRQQMPGRFPIAVNISPRQLHDASLSEFIQRILQENQLEPKDLELEITEGVMLSNASSTTAFLEDMHRLGVQISIDDFGTGYSSLGYLKRLPVSKLKIDQSFVQDIAANAYDDAIIRSIIKLAHQFKLKVVAEGMETESQLRFLRANGCDEIQGFYVSKPVPPEEFRVFALSPQPFIS
ncbi:MAG TPA: EAL domain-containing protein [Methylophilaceae bacterium]|nr:EAL domain-containing protein [Methylophilaceae bacterium]